MISKTFLDNTLDWQEKTLDQNYMPENAVVLTSSTNIYLLAR